MAPTAALPWGRSSRALTVGEQADGTCGGLVAQGVRLGKGVAVYPLDVPVRVVDQPVAHLYCEGRGVAGGGCVDADMRPGGGVNLGDEVLGRLVHECLD